MSMYIVKLVSAYTIIAIFSISTIILVGLITHLCYAYVHHAQNHKNAKKNKQIRYFLSLSILAIVFFAITLILVIAVVLQIILIDAHALHEEQNWIHHVYYDSFEYMEYMIAICDTTAHLLVLIVFLVRFQVTFQSNTLFISNNRLMTILYTCCMIMFIFGAVIIVLICSTHTVSEIIILEIIWEILVDFMCLWLLWLFMSKLYQLLELSLTSQVKQGSHTRSDLLRQIIEATKATITQSKSENSNSGSNKRSKSKSSKSRKAKRKYEPKSQLTMTIDGMKVNPISRSTSPKAPRAVSKTSPDRSEYKSHGNTEITVTTKVGSVYCSDNEQTDNEQTDNETDKETDKEQDTKSISGESATIDLIGVMTKITLLVLFTVAVSVIGVIGNVFIEVQEMKTIEKHDISIEELWAEILPVIDALITSLMLYLQFKFTHKYYRFFLGKLDVWFLTRCLGIIEWWWNKHECDEKTASFLYNSTKSLEIMTHNSENAHTPQLH